MTTKPLTVVNALLAYAPLVQTPYIFKNCLGSEIESMMKEKTMLETWPEDELESVPNCPICGNRRRSLIYEGLAERVHYCAPVHASFARS